MKRFLPLLLVAFLSQPLAAAPPSEEINLDIGTPPVIMVKHTLAQRSSRLVYFLDPGIIGLGYDGMIKLRDASRLNLPQLQIVGKLIDQENPDRNSLIYAIAEGHGGQQYEPAVRAAQIERWKAQFHSGWWIEDEQGNWSKKP
ncbi:MAG: hypothetical protein AW10_02156 [Candidatus Accumulibacter appositus]|uniref:DUF1318 domain-containing protein n=1 Tax=Candidatus Accumulibacter appositus TaxID=1454003 RepID=A0A011QLW5_9PROT|nr:DUF1318 domain-containing protein [Accumulibacter sp.]EXI79859.1 MAG: hypothetical protein AW10_02156 [Candidatus Accumulibacter appositus]HRF05424.1 DUF1318 domain-containing protein [Accumulibacter sp.]